MKEWLEDYRRLRTSSKMRVVQIAQSTLKHAVEPDAHGLNNEKLEDEMIADKALSLTDKVNEVDFVNKWLTSFDYCQEVVDHVMQG